jgi:AbrB family looped-hinge helix DNA binding protein
MASVQRTRRLDAQGRVYIPAEYWAALGLRAGDALTIELVEGELRMRSPHGAIQRARRSYAGTSLRTARSDS